ncbi:hypothetical protein HDU67_006465 [Dinochytrium kinnereticum]|nr:hypothetical protein HDU67_006465 [Dinochytrium kinnereticum]
MDQDTVRFVDYARLATVRAADFLGWAKASKLCKVVTANVPAGIFPKEFENPQLHDIKVDPYGIKAGKKKGPRGSDDAVYRSNEEIRRRVARGNTVLTFQFNGESLSCVPIWALKKFTGGIGDEDDFEESNEGAPIGEESSPVWHRFFTKDPNASTRIVSTMKANGAAGHLAVLKVKSGPGGFVWVGGSKNVHLAIREKDDLRKYSEGRYSIAVKVVEAAWDGFHEPKVNLGGVLDMLWKRHLTACFELLDPEDAHIEDLSYLAKPELHLYSLVSFEKGLESAGYICESPEKTFEEISGYGLITVTAEAADLEISPEKRKDLGADPMLAKIIDGIRGDHGNEGRVLYFLDKDGEVIGMLKKKTVWYIAIRAIREKLKAFYSVDFTLSTTDATVEAPPKSWEPFNPHHYQILRHNPIQPSFPDPNNKSLTQTRQSARKKVAKRMAELATWLGWGESTREAWKKIAVDAVDHVARRVGWRDPDGFFDEKMVEVGEKEREMFLETMKGRFPVMWKGFKESVGVDDRVPLMELAEGKVESEGVGTGVGRLTVSAEAFLDAEEFRSYHF